MLFVGVVAANAVAEGALRRVTQDRTPNLPTGVRTL